MLMEIQQSTFGQRYTAMAGRCIPPNQLKGAACKVAHNAPKPVLKLLWNAEDTSMH